MGQKHTSSSRLRSSYPSAVPIPVGDLKLDAVVFLCPDKFCRRRPECKPGKTDSRISISYRFIVRTKRFFIFLWRAVPGERSESNSSACPRPNFPVSGNLSSGRPLSDWILLVAYPVTYFLLTFLQFYYYFSPTSRCQKVDGLPRILLRFLFRD